MVRFRFNGDTRVIPGSMSSFDNFVNRHAGEALKHWPDSPLVLRYQQNRFRLSDHASAEHAGVVLVSWGGATL